MAVAPWPRGLLVLVVSTALMATSTARVVSNPANKAMGSMRGTADAGNSMDDEPHLQKPKNGSVEVSLLLIFVVLVLAFGVLCSLYSVCAQVKCFSHWNTRSESGEQRGISFEAMRTRSTSYFREDLVNEEELQRLWICFFCDFANYEMKAQCALCGHDKREKEMPATPRSKAQSIRPASLFASMATTASPSHSLSPSPSSFLINSPPPISAHHQQQHQHQQQQQQQLGSVMTPTAATPSSPLAVMPRMPLSPMISPSAEFLRSSSPVPLLTPTSTSTPTAVSEPVVPPPPPGTSYAMLRRRKEWQPALDHTGNVVWEHHSQQGLEASLDAVVGTPPTPSASASGEGGWQADTTATSDDNEPPAELIVQTAFVSHNVLSPAHPHGQLELVDALGAPVYGSSRPEYYNPQSDFLFLDPYAIESMRQTSFPEKHRWFMQETTSMLHVRWENPTTGTNKNDLTLYVPRDQLFHGTMHALIAVSQKQLRAPLRVQFVNEPGVDAGGIVREWFELVMNEFLDEQNGLFQRVRTSSGDGMAYTIHPSASIALADYLLYYRAFGRLLGKALLEGHLIPVPLTDVLLKHFLSVPISFADLQAMDDKLARSLQLLWKTPLVSTSGGGDHDADHVDGEMNEASPHGDGATQEEKEEEEEEDPYGLDFSVYHTCRGVVDLKPNGRKITVTEKNKREYIALFTRWHLGESMADEIAALVSGLHDVIPVHLLAPFDYQELRLMLCGSPVVDVNDWEEHTFVMGKNARSSRMVQWFWRILRSFTAAERAHVLQFATGSARVPVQGFKALTSSDGRLCPFTLHCLPKEECEFIRAYTCFNRLDLPMYKSEKQLEEALRWVLQMDVTGFSLQ